MPAVKHLWSLMSEFYLKMSRVISTFVSCLSNPSFLPPSDRVGQSSQGENGSWEWAAAGRLAGVPKSFWERENVRGVRLHRGKPVLHEPHGEDWNGGSLQLPLQGECATMSWDSLQVLCWGGDEGSGRV